MALNYHLVKRPDMRKDAAAGSELYYASVWAASETSAWLQEAKGLPQKMISIPLSLTMHASYTYRALCLPISRKMPNLKS